MFVNIALALLCDWGLLRGSHCNDGSKSASDKQDVPGLKPAFLPRAPREVAGNIEPQADVEEDGISALGVTLGGGKSSDVFTISPACTDCENLCLDWAEGGGENFLQLWQCNGHENQLWFFESGTFQLQPGADRSICVDAGDDFKPGTTLFAYKCNDAKQQTWSYDEKTKTIYVSSGGKRYCMDLAGAQTALGTAVQLWDCNGLWEQQWNLQPGITMRLTADWTYCLDLAGGRTDNGTPLQLWKCNGLINQKWFFDDYKIKSAADPSKCVDSGNPVNYGDGLKIWDCNGLPQQIFGYSNEFTVTLTRFNNLCLDLKGGQVQDGAVIDAWPCNSCWNQQFTVVGPLAKSMLALQTQGQMPPPVSSISVPTPGSLRGDVDSPIPLTARRALQVENETNQSLKVTALVEAGCPARPAGPPLPPAPASPSKYLLPHCADGDQYGWPKFENKDDLIASHWGQYFQTVYGEIPSEGYPICIYGLSMLYKPVVASSQVHVPTLQTTCPTKPGEYFARMSGFPITIQSWIYNPHLAHPEHGSLPGNHWVEVMHTPFREDGTATWFYYAPGTAIYMWTGNTRAYTDHQDGVQDLLKETCKSKLNECVSYFPALYKAGLAAGIDTLQFMHHKDMQCNTANNEKAGLAVEIVDLHGPGTTACSQTNSGKTRYRTGWQAKHMCYCDDTEKVINCKGFGAYR